MVEMKMGTLLTPMVKTSDYGGLSMEDLSELCADRIVEIADSAPPEIREQARLFKEHLIKLLLEYFNRAAHSERARCIQICARGRHVDAADILRRI